MAGEFDLTPEQMREYGYRGIDTLVDYWSGVRDQPAMRVSSRESLAALLREPLPPDASPFSDVLADAVHKPFSSIGHLNHPRFFGFIPSPSNFVSVLGDALSSGYTPFCGTWLEGSGPAEVELVTLSWLTSLFGLPPSAGGLFVSGGSIANLTALVAIRESKPARESHVIYCSDQTHSSVDRAVRIVGYTDAQFRRLPSDDGYRLDAGVLSEAVLADRRAGFVPVAVIANAGTTNTGAVDPLAALSYVCQREQLWLHVDGAYGAAAVFSQRGRSLLAGIAGVDSITLDPHKWLFQPYALGCLLMREPQRLRDAFHVLPEYLRDTETRTGEINFCDYGPELTRPFRALKLWMSLKVFGADAFARAIDHGIGLAERTEALLRASHCWEVVSAASMAIVCFRYRAPQLSAAEEDELQTAIAHAAAADGRCFLSTTALHGRTVLRMCTIQPTATEDDLRITLDCLREYAESGRAGASLPRR